MQSYFPKGEVTARPYAGIRRSRWSTRRSTRGRRAPGPSRSAPTTPVSGPDSTGRSPNGPAISSTRSKQAGKPFYVYLPYTQVHIPPIPDPQYAGRTRRGNWADILTQMDDFTGVILDKLDELGIAGDTIVVWASDNGSDPTYRFPAIDPDPAGGQWTRVLRPLAGRAVHRAGGLQPDAVPGPLAREGARRPGQQRTGAPGRFLHHADQGRRRHRAG